MVEPCSENNLTGNDRVARVLAGARRNLGTGAITLEPVANMIRLPAGHEEWVIDYHSVSRDSMGRIYVLYNSFRRFEFTRALARFHYFADRDTGASKLVFDRFLGTRGWAEGTAHGLNITRVQHANGSDSDEHIVVVNNEGAILLADLEGQVRWIYQDISRGPQRPTFGVATISDVVGVVDGYGTNANYCFRKSDGQLLSLSGSRGGGTGQSNTNHGLAIDPQGNFVVADRGNRRLTWWSPEDFTPILIDGAQRSLKMPELDVCNVTFFGSHAAVPCLNQKIAFLGPDSCHVSGYQIISVVEMPADLVEAGIDGIHDAEFTSDGRYLIVAVWERHRCERQIPTLTAFKVNWSELSSS